MPNFTMQSPFGFAIAQEIGALKPESYLGDDAWFYLALLEAHKAVGRTRPNPPVGAVIVSGGQIVGRGFTSPAGGHHAEINALIDAGPRARGATLYVTLEPCSHHGRTPPCVGAISEAGIKRVVIGVRDPNPLVDGKGIDALGAAGIQVELKGQDALSAQAQALILPFQKGLKSQLPWVICKVATSLDGRIAQKQGVRTSISGQEAWRLVHRLRNRVDAVAVGSNTVRVDNPQLTVRGLNEPNLQNPIRFVLDGALVTDERSVVYQAGQGDSYVVHTPDASQARISAFDAAGVNRLPVPSEMGHASLLGALKAMQQIGIGTVLFECGGNLLTQFLREGLFDEIWWVVSPTLFGADGPMAIAGELPPDVSIGIDWIDRVALGPDCLFLGHRKNR